MLGLVSSVVLVLLVWEGEAKLLHDELDPCVMVEGDSEVANLGMMAQKLYKGKNVMYHDVENELIFPEESKSFDHPITYIFILDASCRKTYGKPSTRDFAQIVSGGVGERHVSIKFSIPQRSFYDFKVIIRGKPI